jgi:hypothetical protein
VRRPEAATAGRAAALAALIALAMPGTPAAAQQVGLPAWLAGCWVREKGTRRIDEQWMAPRGGLMLGSSRTVRGDTLVEYEHLAIVLREGRPVYRAMPSGQAPAEFTASVAGADHIAFDNPAHDFPQRISYALRGSDSLVARIEGPVQGGTRSAEFAYRRAACPTAADGAP